MIATLSKLYRRRYLRRNSLSTQDLDHFPKLAPPVQRRLLSERLLDQLHHFAARPDALPEWREAARIQNPEDLWSVWPSLPVLTKDLLRQRFNPEETRRHCGLPGRIDSTGGSTGEPTRFYHDRAMLLAAVAAGHYTSVRMGWRPGMGTLCIWGSERDIGKTVHWKIRLHNTLLRQYMVDGYRLSDDTVDRLLSLAIRHRPVALYGFTTMLSYVAERMLARGLELPPGTVRAAWNGGEMLYEQDAALFQKAFHTPLLNRYGGRELSTMACQFKPGDPLWVLRPWLFLEIVDERDKPVRPGEPGRLLWTSTICRGTPFLRYEIGDLGATTSSLVDESGVRGLGELLGRTAGLITLADGRRVSNLFWNHLFKGVPEVRQFQVVIRGGASILFRFAGTGMSGQRQEELLGILGNFLPSHHFEFVWVEGIPRTRQGKLIQVVAENG